MAEIRIEKKSPVWPWVLAVLIILGVVVWFLVDRGEIQVQEDGQVNVPALERQDGNDRNDTLR